MVVGRAAFISPLVSFGVIFVAELGDSSWLSIAASSSAPTAVASPSAGRLRGPAGCRRAEGACRLRHVRVALGVSRVQPAQLWMPGAEVPQGSAGVVTARTPERLITVRFDSGWVEHGHPALLTYEELSPGDD